MVQLVLPDSTGASRRHAALVHHEDGRVYLIDLHSTAGTYHENRKHDAFKPRELQDGDQVSTQPPQTIRSHTYLMQ